MGGATRHFWFLFSSRFICRLYFPPRRNVIPTSDCYQQTLARVRTSPEIAQKIGEPLKVGWLASGSINTSNSSGNADISIPISGPKGKGTIYMVAKKSAGLWKFETLQVEVKGETARIDLLQPQEEKTQEVN
jgi:Cytochrome oxidase complex assembly protein 1